jgi:hypothetical protein
VRLDDITVVGRDKILSDDLPYHFIVLKSGVSETALFPILGNDILTKHHSSPKLSFVLEDGSSVIASIWKNRGYVCVFTRSTCFTPFWYNAPCQYAPLLNLRSLIFDLRPSGCLSSFIQTPTYSIISYGNITFYVRPPFRDKN